jgi:hypothetical protein
MGAETNPEITSKEEQLKGIIWRKVKGDGRNLDWLFESPEDFKIEGVRFNGKGYSVKVHDAYGDQTHEVGLEEEELRAGDFAQEMISANESYRQGLEDQRIQRESRKQATRNKVKRGFRRLIAVGLVSLTAFGAYKHETSPEKVAERTKVRALEEKANLVEEKAVYLGNGLLRRIEEPKWVLSEYQERYILNNAPSNEDTIIATTIREIGQNNKNEGRLCFILNGKTRFISEYWDFDGWDGPSDDAKNLEYLQIKEGDKWIDVKEIPEERRAEYANLILQISKMRERNHPAEKSN